MVECSPATRAARVRFPAVAHLFYLLIIGYYYFDLIQGRPGAPNPGGGGGRGDSSMTCWDVCAGDSENVPTMKDALGRKTYPD